jgi:uncharacterized membrane protein
MILAGIEEWMVLLGRTHPLIVHLPIGILFIAFLLECLGRFQNFANLRPVLPFLWGCAAFTSVIAAIAGYILSTEGGFEDELLTIHQWLGILVTILTVILFILSMMSKNRKSQSTLALAIISFLLIAATGHFGGTLTHGEDYLNEALFSALGVADSDTVIMRERRKIADINEAVVYADLIEPVLQEKCYSCHDQRKQKGKLRLDQYHFILAGGKSGSTLVPGNADESELYKRLLLPDDDKKKMPPRGKKKLTKEEIAMIHWWIQEAKAAADRKVSEVRKPTDIEVVLTSLTSQKEFVSEMESEIPKATVPEISDDLLKPLRDAGLVVNKFSADLPFLTVNCVNAGDFNDDQTELLLPLKDHIIWLKAGSTRVTDAGMKNISQLHRLTRLGLEYNSVSDQGVAALQNLSELRYLNLVGTKVTRASTSSLESFQNLKALYLWNTGFTASDRQELSQKLPGTEINIGEQ